MDHRKAKSQPSLPQRIWSTSELPQIPRSHSVSARQGGLVDIRNEVRDQGARPFSSLPNRPDSRMDSRPQSRIGSRPQSRIGSRPQQLLERPKSGVRPLSGRVFMRRTSERGWVAKAYPEDRTNSQTDVNLFDDLSDCESLDSFFDDEFDIEEQEEKLGNLLSCNTLGVESRGRRPDWVAGDVGIPKFHCPRCRDHWYGISSYPCDEELARLIREGLWYTGKGDGNKPKRNQGQRNLHRPTSGKKEFESISNESLTQSKVPNLRRHNMSKGERSSTNFYVGQKRDGDKKKKKRITFKLDNDDEEYSDVSTTGLDEGDSKNRGSFSQFRSDSDTLGEGVGGMKGTGNGGSGREGGSDGLSQAGKGGSGLYNGLGNGENGDGTRGQRSSSLDGDLNDGNSSDGKNGRQLNNETRTSSSKFKRGRETDVTGSTVNELNKANQQSKVSGSGFGSNFNGMGTGPDGRTTGSGIFGADGEHLYNGNSVSLGSNEDMNNRSQKSSSNDQTKNNNLRFTSQVSQSDGRGRGSRRGSLHGQPLGQEDHGKNVRKAVGYMRAASPTSSEWGDPLHARSFISSTATSRSGSTTNLLRSKQRDEEEEKARSYLPPIVPSIEKKRPLIDLSDLMDGFQFTRAWTFSYHN